MVIPQSNEDSFKVVLSMDMLDKMVKTMKQAKCGNITIEFNKDLDPYKPLLCKGKTFLDDSLTIVIMPMRAGQV